MKVFLTMLLLPCCTVGLLREGIAELDDTEQHFEAFVAQHGRVYATVQERAHRFAIFKVCASLFFPAYLFCLHHTLSQYSTPNMLTAACPYFAHPRNVPPCPFHRQQEHMAKSEELNMLPKSNGLSLKNSLPNFNRYSLLDCSIPTLPGTKRGRASQSHASRSCQVWWRACITVLHVVK